MISTMAKKFATIFQLVSLLLLIFATNSRAEPPIKVGAILHLTGDLAMVSAAFREGIELAIGELNEASPRYSLIVEDGQNSPKSSNSAAQKLINRDKVEVAILSSYLDVMSSGQLFERKEIPTICIWDSNPEIDDAGKYIFAIGPWTPSAGEAASEFIHNSLNGKQAVIFYNADTWSEGVVKFFREDFTKRGGRVLDAILLNPQETDFRTVLTRAAALNPDVLYTPLVFNLVPFYSQLHQLKFSKPVVSSDIIADEHIVKAPEAFEGIYQTGIADPSSPEYQEMARAYQQKYGRPVTLPWFVAVGYDSIKLIDRAVTQYGRRTLKESLYQIKDYPGASATLTINDKGTSPQMEVMFRVKEGKLKMLGR